MRAKTAQKGAQVRSDVGRVNNLLCLIIVGNG